MDEFVTDQSATIKKLGGSLQGKNVEIENAVMDLVRIILTYPIDEKIEAVSHAEVDKLVKHYDNFMYQALLHCTKNSPNAIKPRLGKSLNFGGVGIKSPMFQISLQM